MKVVQLTNFEQAQEYGMDWNDLLDTSKDKHVFLTLEWLEAWWNHFGAERELLLLAVVNSGKILALAPLMVTSYELFFFSLRNIEFIGTPASDYQSFILTQENSMCTRMLLDYIKRQSWDCIELKNIPKLSETAEGLKASSGEPLALKEREMDVCPFVPLPGTFEEYLDMLRGRTRKDLRRLERQLGKKHKLEYKRFNQTSLTLEEAMDTFFGLHQKRWQSLGNEGKFAEQVFRDFHMDLARRFNEKGWLHLSFLTLDDEPIAADYCFEYGQKVYEYLTGFDPQYSRYGVGNLSRLHSIETCIKRGLKEYDMLRGEHSYKERWSSLNRRTVEFSVVRWKPVPKAYDWLVRGNIIPPLSSRLRKRAFYNKL